MTETLTHQEIKAMLASVPLPITRDDLEVRLQNCRKGARPITVIATTKPSNMRVKDKDGTPLPGGWRDGKGKSEVWHVRKRAVVNGFCQYDYERAVNAELMRQGKEPDFEAGERSWGDRRQVEGKTRCCLVDHGLTYCQNPDCKHKFAPTVEGQDEEAVCPECQTPRVFRTYLSIYVRRSLGYHYFLDTDGSYLDPDLVHSYMGEKPPEVIKVRDYCLDNIERVSIDGLMLVVEGTPAHAEYLRRAAA